MKETNIVCRICKATTEEKNGVIVCTVCGHEMPTDSIEEE